MNKILRDKKGIAKFFEFIILLPIVMFIVLFTYYRIMQMATQNNMNKFNNILVREASKGRDLEQALNKIAYICATNNKNYMVQEVSVVKKQNDQYISFTLNFGIDEKSNKKFSDFITENNEFDLNKFMQSSQESYQSVASEWSIGNFIEVVVYNDLSNNIFSHLTKINLGSGTLSFGIADEMTTSDLCPISNQKNEEV